MCIDTLFLIFLQKTRSETFKLLKNGYSCKYKFPIVSIHTFAISSHISSVILHKSIEHRPYYRIGIENWYIRLPWILLYSFH